jgi:hypothetical protein
MAAALKNESEPRRVPMSEIGRDALALHLARLGRERIVDGKRVIPFAGIASSDGQGPFARDLQEVLRKEWTVENMIDPHRRFSEDADLDRSEEP